MPRTRKHDGDFRSLVKSFTEQLKLLIKRAALERVVAALQSADGSLPRQRGPGRPRGSGRRSSADQERMGAELLAHVRAHPGQRADQIAAALGTDVITMRAPMKKLLAARQVRTEGQRRGMTYFPAGPKGGGGGGGGGGRKRSASKASGKPRSKRKAKRSRRPARRKRVKARGLVPVAKPKPRPKSPGKAPSAPVAPQAPKRSAEEVVSAA